MANEDRMMQVRELLAEREAEESAVNSRLQGNLQAASAPLDAMEGVPDMKTAIMRAVATGLPTLLARGIGGKNAGGAAAKIGRKSLMSFEETDKKNIGRSQKRAAANAALDKEELKERRKSRMKLEDSVAEVPLDVEKARLTAEAVFPWKEKVAQIGAHADAALASAMAHRNLTNDQSMQTQRLKDSIDGDLKSRGDLVKRVGLLGQAKTAVQLGNAPSFAALQTNLPLIAGESSRLTEGDIERSLKTVFKGDIEKVKNYWFGTSKTPLQPDQQKAVMLLLDAQSAKVAEEIEKVRIATVAQAPTLAGALTDEHRGIVIDSVFNSLRVAYEDPSIKIVRKKDGSVHKGRDVWQNGEKVGFLSVKQLTPPTKETK